MQERLQKLIQEALEDKGFVLVRALISGEDTLQIMAEHKDLSPMSIDDCGEISRVLSVLFSVKAPELADYTLEVSSPGIDRPLLSLQDYERFKGRDAKIETTSLIEERKRFKGVLKGVDEKENIHLLFEDREILIPFSVIARAKLLIPADLLKKHK